MAYIIYTHTCMIMQIRANKYHDDSIYQHYIIYSSPLKFPLRNWVAQVCLQIPKGVFFVKAQGGRDPGFCRQHMGFVDMLGWNNVIRSNSFFYPVFARGTSHMCFVEGHVFRPGAIWHQCLKHVCGPHVPARCNHICGMAKQPTPSLQETSVCTTSTL